jgi:tyrosine-protein phosphatase non-receptor type 12/18/22
VLKASEAQPINGSDYINASVINSSIDTYYKYIAAQGPTKETCIDFVRMLVQYKVKLVICACNEYEGQKLKCHRYWPESSEPYSIYKNYYALLKSEPVQLEDCIIRNMKIKYINSSSSNSESLSSSTSSTNSNSTAIEPGSAAAAASLISSDFEYDFTQIHLNNWPDHGVPENIEPIINIISLVRQKMIENNKFANESLANKAGGKRSTQHLPLSNDFLVVHCSAGCGRTGTIIAIDQLWNLLNENVSYFSFVFLLVLR